MKVALVYDRVNKWGGAERDLLALHELFPDAPLFTSVYDSKKTPWANVFPQVIPTFLQKIPLLSNKHEYLGTLMPLAFESLDFSGFDIVISVTSEAAKGIIVRPPTLHICYLLTPTRYLWSHYETYFKEPVLKMAGNPAVAYLRIWDRIAAQRPDIIIAQSKVVEQRIKKYYGRTSKIIYPPANIEYFSKGLKEQRENFFLMVSRLVPYKKVDLAIEAFNTLALPLYIVGVGSEEKGLKRAAHGNIKFLGELTDAKLADYYKRCAAFVMPQEEDFGLTAVEAQAAGAPVIAYRAGGALDIVAEGKSGLFFNRQSPEALVRAVNKFKKYKFDYKIISRSAERFSKERFRKEFSKLVQKTYGRI